MFLNFTDELSACLSRTLRQMKRNCDAWWPKLNYQKLLGLQRFCWSEAKVQQKPFPVWSCGCGPRRGMIRRARKVDVGGWTFEKVPRASLCLTGLILAPMQWIRPRRCCGGAEWTPALSALQSRAQNRSRDTARNKTQQEHSFIHKCFSLYPIFCCVLPDFNFYWWVLKGGGWWSWTMKSSEIPFRGEEIWKL